MFWRTENLKIRCAGLTDEILVTTQIYVLWFGISCIPFVSEVLNYLTFREGWRYQIGWFFGNIPNGLRPPPSFLENYIAIFYNGYGCIFARRYEGQIVWNACTWFPDIGVIQYNCWKKKHTLNPEITLLYQFHAQKNLFKVPKTCDIIVWIKNDPAPFGTFPRIQPIW